MKTLTITVTNAINYKELDSRPVPVPTETAIPEADADYVMFQVKNQDGGILCQLAISNYFHLKGIIDDHNVINEWRNVRDRPAREANTPERPARVLTSDTPIQR